MDPKTTSFKIGDSVKVKPGTLDPDTEAFSIGGWQGRIIGIMRQENGMTLIDIQWDSLTLHNMPKQSIEFCEEEGFDWTQMGLYAEDLELTSERDTQEDVKRVQEELATIHHHSYSWLGEEGTRIQQILAGVNHEKEREVFERWRTYLEHHLSFPFEAIVDEWQERGPLCSGDTVYVKKISLVDEVYGIIVSLKRRRKHYDFPLCDLAATDKTSSNAQLIQDYRVWFANR